MTSIQLQIIHSDGSLRRETFTQGPVAFGREVGNQILFNENLVSRRHGVFHQQDDHWLLENLSDNGTWINGKRIKRKAVPVNAGDVISVGDQDILRVEAILMPSGQAAPTTASTTTLANATAATPKPAGSATSRKMRLWLTLAGFWVVILALLVFMQPLYNNSRSSGPQWQTRELNADQISQAVREKPRDIARGVQPSERRVSEYLAEAREISSRLDSGVDAHFRAYRAYQRAMAYSGRDMLDDSRDLRTFTEIERELIQGVTTRYNNAYAKMRANNFREAEAAFRNLANYFPDVDNSLMKNVEALRKEMSAQARRRR